MHLWLYKEKSSNETRFELYTFLRKQRLTFLYTLWGADYRFGESFLLRYWMTYSAGWRAIRGNPKACQRSHSPSDCVPPSGKVLMENSASRSDKNIILVAGCTPVSTLSRPTCSPSFLRSKLGSQPNDWCLKTKVWFYIHTCSSVVWNMWQNLTKVLVKHINTELQDLKFPPRCCWRFKSSGTSAGPAAK